MASLSRHQILQRNFLATMESAAKWRADEHPVDAPREPVTPEDKLKSLAHMINDIGLNHAHARNHVVSMMQNLQDGDSEAAIQNGDHAQKHMLHAQQAAEKLGQHIKMHMPDIVSELKKLHGDNPLRGVIDHQ